ncbi:MAG: DUF4184 family protein [Bacteroidota bacterium]
MPFTFSHPAAVLPLRLLPSHWFSLTGLIIGSMVPDFEYFLRMKVESNFSHTIAGIFLFDLPVGVIIAYVFYNIAAAPLIDNAPAFLSSRFSFLKNSNWNNYFRNNVLKVCLSIILGAISHIVWDNFTHEHGHFASAIPEFSERVNIFGIQMGFYHVLQHLSTLGGAFVIAVYVLLLPTDTSYKASPSAKYWSVVVILFFLLVIIRIRFGLGANWFNNLAVSSISAGLIAVVFTPLLLFRRK